MNNCLVTKLPGKVTDTSLLKVGDMKFHIVLNEEEQSLFPIQAVLGGKVTATIANVVKGNPTFSDGSLTIVNNSEFPKPIYQTSVATEYQEFDIVISNKYDLRYLDSPTCTMGAFDMKSLEYCSRLETICINGEMVGDSSVLRGMTALQALFVRGAGFRLDLNDLKECPLKTLEVDSRAGSDMKFSIEPLRNMTHKGLTNLTLSGVYGTEHRGITGDLSVLQGFTGLKKLSISYTSIGGNLSALSGFAELEGVYASECNFEGDLTDLPPKCLVFSNNAGSKNTWFTWTDSGRSDKYAYVLFISYPINLRGTDVENMLQDQTKCTFLALKDNQGNEVLNEIKIRTDDNHQYFLENCQGLGLLLSDLTQCPIAKLEIDGELFIDNFEIVYEGFN